MNKIKQILDKKITFINNNKEKIYYTYIEGYPYPIYLLIKDDYDKYKSEINDEFGKNRLLEALNSAPAEILNKILPKTLDDHPYGPGTILHLLLKKIGIKLDIGCSCVNNAIAMNERGTVWCYNNINIIVGWLKAEAIRRKIFFNKYIAKILILYAICKSIIIAKISNEPRHNK